MLLRLLAVVAIFASVGCKVTSSGSSNATKQSFTYDFTENGCWTGTHTAATVAEICTKLDDDTLNKGCAYSMRAAKFSEYNCHTVMGNKPSATGATTTREKWSYEVQHNGCTTGKKSFTSKWEYCKTIQDDSANNNCGHDSRMLLAAMNDCL